uniref:5-oxoprolinase-like n=1 Tax=Saccoglossus kowalevskii TaxID=10224 RepID=A0ABM0MT14_SACKO|nr:PREDICTED: 5-oxoprolinase-like [Saccoglossus kowalevskii]
MCSTLEDHYKAHADSCRHGDFEKSFTDRYKREFGFTIPGRLIIIDDIRVRGTGKTHIGVDEIIKCSGKSPRVDNVHVVKCFFEEVGFLDTNIYKLNELTSGHEISGPAILIETNSTILVEPNCLATITAHGDVRIQIGTSNKKTIDTELDAIQLSIFSHRFMSTAEQMGRVLQRTAISTNIKERLDFSCAMFGPDGGLVANAPHIPVHLGAMQEAVQYQMSVLGDDLHEGDVILSNHPSAGGSHLPDFTVITPVFYKTQPKPVFFVASRGHHADIGGITPGSMPPHSKSLDQEGAVFKTFKVVKDGIYQEEALIEQLMAPGKLPGCSGTRNLHDNLSDVKAQIAANHKIKYSQFVPTHAEGRLPVVPDKFKMMEIHKPEMLIKVHYMYYGSVRITPIYITETRLQQMSFEDFVGLINKEIEYLGRMGATCIQVLDDENQNVNLPRNDRFKLLLTDNIVRSNSGTLKLQIHVVDGKSPTMKSSVTKEYVDTDNDTSMSRKRRLDFVTDNSNRVTPTKIPTCKAPSLQDRENELTDKLDTLSQNMFFQKEKDVKKVREEIKEIEGEL